MSRARKRLGGVPQRMLPEFNPAVPAADFGAHGVALERGFGWLDLIARLHGLTTLMTFCDLRPVPGGLEKWLNKLHTKTPEQVWAELAKATDKAHGPWTDWFPAEQGLGTVEGLLPILEREGWKPAVDALRREYPAMMKGKFEPAAVADVVADLRALATCLRVAGEKGARFRLARTSPLVAQRPSEAPEHIERLPLASDCLAVDNARWLAQGSSS